MRDRPPLIPNEPGASIELSIVIPAYNEARDLEASLRSVTRYLDSLPFVSELIVVDDGSTDGTDAILERCRSARPSLRVLRNPSNLGKGESVRRGMLSAQGRYVFFMDADLSVPVDELTGALAALTAGGHGVLIGSRRVRGARIEGPQPVVRIWLGLVFTSLARLLLSPAIVDFTCGFKGFRREDARRLFSLQTCADWAFDAEVLYLARLLGTPVLQHPVRWRHRRSSRVRFPRDIYRSLTSLVRIRMRSSRALREQTIPGTLLSRQRDCED